MLCIMSCGPNLRGCAKNCAPRGDFIKNLTAVEPEGMTFEGPDGAGFAWDLVGLPAG